MNYFNKLVFASLFAASLAFAQGSNAHLGIHVGLGMESLAFSTSEEDEINGESARLALAIGGVYSMQLSESVNLVPGVLLNYAAMPGEKSSDISLNIPVIFKFYTFDFLYLQVGPQIGFSFYYADNETGKKSKDRSAFNAGPTFGFGYQIDANSSIDARFYYGMTKYFNIIDPGAQAIQVLLGYTYLF